MANVISRLAPSPTGMLHLGNAWAFFLNWLYVRSHCGSIFLRIDDIDPQRSKQEYLQAALDDLIWLGLDWNVYQDSCNKNGYILQSSRIDKYEQAICQLERQKLVYPCFCTRRDLRSLASAPQIGDMGVPYPGTCSGLPSEEIERNISKGKPACIRLRCSTDIVVDDLVYGQQKYSPVDFGGDFALRRSDGVIAYQLASTVDDGQFGINFVMRGRDILPSTPRQLYLMRLLGYCAPQFAHLPLLLDEDGQRLAKRHDSMSLRSIRARGVPAKQVIGLLAYIAGINPAKSPLTATELIGRLDLNLLPKGDIILSKGCLDKFMFNIREYENFK